MKQSEYIEAILTNDLPKLRAMYQALFPAISKMVQENSGSVADAKDVFQEAISTAFEKVKQPDFRLESKFSTFLYAIAFNKWRSKRKKKSFLEVSISQDAALIADDSFESDEHEKAEQRHLLYRAFDRLGEDCRKVLLMFFDGKTMVEIAETMGFAGENYAARRKHMCKEQLVGLVKSYPEYRELRIQ